MLMISCLPHARRAQSCHLAGAALTSAATLFLAAAQALGQCAWQSFDAFNPNRNENLGRSVAVGTSLFVAGAPAASHLEGTARLFRRSENGWSLQTVLHTGELDVLNLYGTAAAMNGERLVVTDPAGQEGTVQIFRIEGGNVVFEQRLSSLEVGGLGRTVALSGDAILAGAPFHPTQGLNGAGAAYAFRLVDGTWTLENEFVAPTPKASDFFGSGVAIVSDVAVVGALGVDGSNDTTGAVFVHRRARDGWSLEQTLVPTDPPTGSKYFGGAVAIDLAGTTIAVGAERTDGNKGAVHLFKYDGVSWQLQQVLVPPTVAATAHFGADVALSQDGQTLVVGAYSDYSAAPAAGAAYIYRLIDGTWQEAFKFAVPDGDCVGASVAIHGDIVVVGDPCYDSFSGRVHVIAGVQLIDCNGNGVNDGCDIASGFSKDIDQDGVPDECRRLQPSPDINGDGIVDGTDLGMLLLGWGDCPPADGKSPCVGDLDGDGAVTRADLGVLLSAWGDLDWSSTCNSASGASCCGGHDTPGCNDPACCAAICATDPFCCESHWDAICANTAQATCGCPPPPGCGDPKAADCCLPSQVIPGSPGCDDAVCCELICDFIDPFCCEVEWDASCATWALQFCQPCRPLACGLGTNDCCTISAPALPGCNDFECCMLICDLHPPCCDSGWGFFCELLAFMYCRVCGGTPP